MVVRGGFIGQVTGLATLTTFLIGACAYIAGASRLRYFSISLGLPGGGGIDRQPFAIMMEGMEPLLFALVAVAAILAVGIAVAPFAERIMLKLRGPKKEKEGYILATFFGVEPIVISQLLLAFYLPACLLLASQLSGRFLGHYTAISVLQTLDGGCAPCQRIRLKSGEVFEAVIVGGSERHLWVIDQQRTILPLGDDQLDAILAPKNAGDKASADKPNPAATQPAGKQ